MGKKILSIFFILILCVPMALWGYERYTGKKADAELGGYFDRLEIGRPTLKHVWDGSFQQNFTNWFGGTFSPRGFLIKTYSELKYKLFREGTLVIGKDDDLFQYPYIDAELCLDDKTNFALEKNREDLKRFVGRLEDLKGELEKRGKHLFVYITPNKACEDRENIPYQYTAMEPEGAVRAVDLMREYLDASSVEHLFTEDLKDRCPVKLFYKTGIHWSRPYEQIVTNEVLDRVAKLTGKTYRTIALTELQKSDKPVWRDADIFDTLNIWDGYFEDEYYVYKTEPVIPEVYDSMNILIQGGSFADGLQGDICGIYWDENVQYINYNVALYDQARVPTQIGKNFEGLPIGDLIENSDCVVIEMNESIINAYTRGTFDWDTCSDYEFGFVDFLYSALTAKGE